MKYIGLTIGPIFKTLEYAKKTREIWSASYLFSFIMKQLILKLREKGISTNKILVPNTEHINETINTHHAGLFPDRLIFQSSEGDFETLKIVVDDTINMIASGISEKMNVPVGEVRFYLDNYLKIYFLEKELKDGDNPILKLSPYLDAIELHEKFLFHDGKQAIPKFLKLKKKDFLTKDAGLNDRFKSLVEISTGPLKDLNKAAYDRIIKEFFSPDETDDKEEDEGNFIMKFKGHKSFKNEFKLYHKYIAIVQADGDNIGSSIKQLGNDPGVLSNFSKQLTAFSKDALQLINKYEGVPVYAGGDDLLFFAPVANRNSKENIFDLVHALDEKYKKRISHSSLSFGISITYYKFPLNEALEEARNLLFNNAKKHKEREKEKNAVAFKILKHSGRGFGATFYKDGDIYKTFKRLLSEYSANQKYLNSIVETLQSHVGIFSEIFKNVDGNPEKRIENFFKNSFNEEIHKEFDPYISDVAKLTYSLYHLCPTSEEESDKKEKEDKIDKRFQILYAVLRTLNFFNQDDNER